jgi:3-phosphoshikimate 1-carboxyvinyltransferase
MNRALICSSYSNELQLNGESSCDDVIKMKAAIEALKKYKPTTTYDPSSVVFDCGAAGTVLRFLSLRLSRIPGYHILRGTPRLMQRPQKDLLDLFTRLGVKYELQDEKIILNSQGWKNISDPIEVQREVSSQFASGIILNAWNLKDDLVLKMVGHPISEGYFEMTLQVVKQLGMKVEVLNKTDHQLCTVKTDSHINIKSYDVESDLSSTFAIAAFATLNGQAVFENFPSPSLQPDFEFVNILKKMGITVELKSNELTKKELLTVQSVNSYNGVEANLKSCPDLFPVLALLCAFATSDSRLYGAPQLIHKESDRISKVSELLTFIKIRHEKKSDGILIYPNNYSYHTHKQEILPFTYDTDHDHRLAFAAALVKSLGFPITIRHPEVVTKSFSEFWTIVNI